MYNIPGHHRTIKLIICLCFIFTNISNCKDMPYTYPPYYRVTTNSDIRLSDEVGLFQKTDATAEYNEHVTPVYKKGDDQFQS